MSTSPADHAPGLHCVDDGHDCPAHGPRWYHAGSGTHACTVAACRLDDRLSDDIRRLLNRDLPDRLRATLASLSTLDDAALHVLISEAVKPVDPPVFKFSTRYASMHMYGMSGIMPSHTAFNVFGTSWSGS